jgi:hypothetical protein
MAVSRALRELRATIGAGLPRVPRRGDLYESHKDCGRGPTDDDIERWASSRPNRVTDVKPCKWWNNGGTLAQRLPCGG